MVEIRTTCAATGKGPSGMIRRMRDGWQRFEASKPGRRFRDRYHRYQRSRQGRSALRKVLVIVSGIVVVFTSLLLAPLPGPGWGTVLLGLVIIAGEILIVARFLDQAEPKLRGPARRAKVVWASLPPATRLLIGTLAPVCGAVLGIWALLSVF